MYLRRYLDYDGFTGAGQESLRTWDEIAKFLEAGEVDDDTLTDEFVFPLETISNNSPMRQVRGVGPWPRFQPARR